MAGVFLGIFVTLSSVGAGAFGAAVLIILYPYLKAIKIVGTDIARSSLNTYCRTGSFVVGKCRLLASFRAVTGLNTGY